MNTYNRLLSQLARADQATDDIDAIRLSNCYILTCEIFPELTNTIDALKVANAIKNSMFKPDSKNL